MAGKAKQQEFTAGDYRKMAARFDLMPADDDGLTVCEWCENDGPAVGDGDYIPSSDERTLKAMLLYAARMAEERNTGRKRK